MLMYCQLSSHESGGGTTFGKAGIHIQPLRNQAVFFTYRDEDGNMDVCSRGLTCLVAYQPQCHSRHPRHASHKHHVSPCPQTGFTEQSGCPVKKGQKWVVTQWLRDEVSIQNSWVHFDPQGSRMSNPSTIGLTGDANEGSSPQERSKTPSRNKRAIHNAPAT